MIASSRLNPEDLEIAGRRHRQEGEDLRGLAIRQAAELGFFRFKPTPKPSNLSRRESAAHDAKNQREAAVFAQQVQAARRNWKSHLPADPPGQVHYAGNLVFETMSLASDLIGAFNNQDRSRGTISLKSLRHWLESGNLACGSWHDERAGKVQLFVFPETRKIIPAALEKVAPADLPKALAGLLPLVQAPDAMFSPNDAYILAPEKLLYAGLIFQHAQRAGEVQTVLTEIVQPALEHMLGYCPDTASRYAVLNNQVETVCAAGVQAVETLIARIDDPASRAAIASGLEEGSPRFLGLGKRYAGGYAGCENA